MNIWKHSLRRTATANAPVPRLLSVACRLSVCLALGVAALADEPPAPRRVVFDAPGHACAEGVATKASGGVPGARWALVDWRGRETGVSGTFDAEGRAEVPPMPAGYYRMVGGDAQTHEASLGSLAVVAGSGAVALNPGPFYGIDSAQSWAAAPDRYICPWNGGDTFRTVSDLIALAGFRHVRDRLRWSEVERSPGAVSYGKYMRNADLLRERGIAVSGMFHDCPQWAGRAKKLPMDLNAVFKFCSRLATDFGGRMGDWEFWNEEDKGFAPEPVWDYAAALKAAYLGFKSGDPGMTVLYGAICQPPDGDYARALYDNDAAKFSDALNYHTYDPPSAYGAIFPRLRRLLADYGVAGRAIWVTESGTNQEGLSKGDGAMPGLKAHSPGQELVVAEFYPKSQIAFQMEGVARNYFFTFCPYSERNGKKDWGVMRRDGTVKPVFSAMAAMLRETSGATLAGRMQMGDGLRAYIFDRPDGLQTVAFWAESPVDKAGGADASQDFAKEMTLPTNFQSTEACRLSDMCGRISSIAPTNGTFSLSATRYPSYLTGRFGLSADVPAIPAGLVSPYEPLPDEDLTVVVRAELNPEDFEITNRKTHAMLKGRTGRVRLSVWNLGDESKSGHLETTGGSISGLPESVALGPRGSAPVVFDCIYEPPSDVSSSVLLTVRGVFGGRRSSRLAIPMVPCTIFENCEATPIAFEDPGKWKRNSSAPVWSVDWDDAEKAIRFHAAWTDSFSDRWFYPVLPLRLPEESLEGAVAVRFKVKSTQDKVENDFFTSLFMMVNKDGSSSFVDFPEPTEEWEPRVAFLGAKESLSAVSAIRIGGNPCGTDLTYWIRDLEILKAK